MKDHGTIRVLKFVLSEGKEGTTITKIIKNVGTSRQKTLDVLETLELSGFIKFFGKMSGCKGCGRLSRYSNGYVIFPLVRLTSETEPSHHFMKHAGKEPLDPLPVVMSNGRHRRGGYYEPSV